ncbi:MAG: DnaD domain protein [Clostridiales bacterium]|nr:DnaD domain protein [Clostridiales bacterium]
MPVFRVEKNNNYTVMANYHLKDASLSLKAKGLLSLMLSLPNNWDYSLNGLVRICKEEYASISSGVKELENAGYIVRNQERDVKGRLSNIVYTIYEKPVDTTSEPLVENPLTENPLMENPITENPITENPLTENPITENPITENPITENPITENPITEDPITENPITEDPITENPHESNTNQLSTKQLSTKQQNTKEQRSTDFLTEQVREAEKALDDLISEISDVIGRPLTLKEKRTCSIWIETEEDREMIMLAVEDNLFRDDMFDLKYVLKTLDEWRKNGITDPKGARNYILDNHVANLAALAGDIEASSHRSGKREEIMSKNELADLQAYRDLLISTYKQGDFNRVISIYTIASWHKDLFDYLPKEIQTLIKKRINNTRRKKP